MKNNFWRDNKCEHKRIKRNFPFGKKSKPISFCKDCKTLIDCEVKKKRRTGRKKIKWH